MGRQAFLPLVPGSVVWAEGRRHRITHLLGVDRVLAIDTETKAVEQFRIEQLSARNPADGDPTAASAPLPPEDLTDEQRSIAEKRLALIQPLIRNSYRTRADAIAVAKEADVNVATIYEWMRLYLESGHLSSLVPEKRGRKKGSKKLSQEVEKVIKKAIDEVLLTKQKHKQQVVIDEVNKQCRVAKLPAPHPNTVRNRIRELPAREVMSRRGLRDKTRNLFEPIRGKFPGGDFPLAVVEIDHTSCDIVIVETRTRLPLGRPWITVAVDVYSRMVVGVHISMDAPNSTSVGICLARAMLPKGQYLAHLGVPGEWPVWGHLRTVHCDNAKEFRGSALGRACAAYGIDLQFRPGKRPNYGGHIERLIGTAANEIRNLPGATFSCPKEREGYDSDEQSAMTLDEFEQYLVDFIVNVYHQRIHSELGVPPRRQWEIGVLGDSTQPGIGPPDMPSHPERLRIDFLPFVERTVQNYGVAFEDIHYYHEVLGPWINALDPDDNKHKRRFRIHYDSRDLSVVYFYDPAANEYYSIPYRDMTHPPVSLWEVTAAKRRLAAEGKSQVDESSLFEAVERLRERVQSAIAKTKSARRHQHRVDQTKKQAIKKANAVPPSASSEEPQFERSPIEDDIFSKPKVPLSVEVSI